MAAGVTEPTVLHLGLTKVWCLKENLGWGFAVSLQKIVLFILKTLNSSELDFFSEGLRAYNLNTERTICQTRWATELFSHVTFNPYRIIVPPKKEKR